MDLSQQKCVCVCVWVRQGLGDVMIFFIASDFNVMITSWLKKYTIIYLTSMQLFFLGGGVVRSTVVYIGSAKSLGAGVSIDVGQISMPLPPYPTVLLFTNK